MSKPEDEYEERLWNLIQDLNTIPDGNKWSRALLAKRMIERWGFDAESIEFWDEETQTYGPKLFIGGDSEDHEC